MHENGHNNYVMFMFIQLLGKYQDKDMNMYIEPLIDKSWSYGMASLCMTSLDQ